MRRHYGAFARHSLSAPSGELPHSFSLPYALGDAAAPVHLLYARKDWKSYTKRNLWLLFIVDTLIAGLYNYVIYRNPINEYTNYLLTEIWIRPTIIYGLVACFASEKER